ncbi:MAG TPA: hypothetical protein VJG49_01925 [Candidatus Nanoarchaeia archaeon]|nr:hypothetical protein [Candidatus Nanoarchaeia archaeon]
MAKTKPAVEIKPEVKAVPSSRPHYLPKLALLFGALLIAVAIIDYFKYFILDGRIIDLLLAIAGLWMIIIAFEQGFYKRRKELLKRYI